MQPSTAARTEVKKILIEAMLVAIAGTVLAWAANAVSPRGLALARDYFPGSASRPQPTNPPASSRTNTNAPTKPNTGPAGSVLLELRDHGLQFTSHDQAVQFFHDSRHQQGLILFVDARDDENYQAGHIPGAWEFDHYHPEKYLADVMAAAQSAEQVVVYCHGGDCDDSIFAAMNLREAGVPSTKLSVYAGGFTAWTASHLPVELGARNSGHLQNAKP